MGMGLGLGVGEAMDFGTKVATDIALAAMVVVLATRRLSI